VQGPATASPPTAHRLLWIDQARTVLLAAMASFHLTVDLEMFGLISDRTLTPPWALYARLIAGGFVAISGFSLWLAHGRMLVRRKALTRIAIIAAGAAAVSAATRFALPNAWVFFGILHCIAVSSLVGLVFLRAPAPLTGLAAIAAILLPQVLFFEGTAPLALAWTGLWQSAPRAVDFEPVLPWTGVFLAGLALGQALGRAGRIPSGRAGGPPWAYALAWPGRHSLAFYLIHQPILFGLVWIAARASA
jgi:uncharacterized membrane protein